MRPLKSVNTGRGHLVFDLFVVTDN